jgi:hypothetical protein
MSETPKLKSIDIKIQMAARRAQEERNAAAPKEMNVQHFNRGDHLHDGTVKPVARVLTVFEECNAAIERLLAVAAAAPPVACSPECKPLMTGDWEITYY